MSQQADHTTPAQPPAAATNPFAAGAFVAPPHTAMPAQRHFLYSPTTVPQQQLRAFPYKTSNRILDDMRLTPAFAAAGQGRHGVASLLNSRPLAYRHAVAALARGPAPRCLVLNTPLAHAPLVLVAQHPDDGVVVSVVRGLIVDTGRAAPSGLGGLGLDGIGIGGNPSAPRVAGHFCVQILDSAAHSFPAADKHQYHVVPRDMVSVDDRTLLADAATRGGEPLDDAFFKCLGSPANHIMRVTVYGPEWTGADLAPLAAQEPVRTRYLAFAAQHPDAPLAPDAVPSPVHCFQTLLKVLKGPVLLPAGEPTHTISRKKTCLDAKLDVDLLFRRLAFTLPDGDDDSLVPPNLSLQANLALRERYIRMATELVFLGKTLKLQGRPNDFDVSFSFSDNLSQVHALLAEVDKHTTLAMAWDDASNLSPDYVALSCYAYFQDELVIRCYEHTVNSDPANKMNYVDCFALLVHLRARGNSTRLLSYYNNQYLKGLMYGLSDYRNALRALGVEGPADDDAVADEDTVLAIYKASCKLDPKNYTYFNKQLRTICAITNSLLMQKFLRDELVPQDVALDEMRIEDLTEDEVVITAYEFRLDEVMQSTNFNADSPDVTFLQKCLLSIAVVRKSYLLMSYIDIHMPELLRSPKSYTLQEAAELIGVTDSTSDFDIISSFQEKLMNSSFEDEVDIRGLRAALEVLARHNASEILLSFLKNGKIDESLLPAENWPTGLDNIGNTCYLNSLLQYYFSIKPLREFILDFDEKSLDLLKLCSRKIGGRLVEEAEGDRSIQFIYRLQELFKEMITTDKRYIQPSKELVYLSFLPLSQLVNFEDLNVSDTEMADSSTEDIIQTDVTPEDNPFSETDFLETQSKSAGTDLIDVDSIEPDETLSTDSKRSLPPRKEDQLQTRIMKIGSDQIESAIEIGRQQDVTECIENVTYQIETALEPEYLEDDGEQYDLIKRLFSGRTKQTITPLEREAQSRVSFERFFSLIINVGDHPRDIYDALDNYFGENVVNLEEGKVKMTATILKTPEILQFHVQRVLFDRERLMAYKSLEVIPFGETIYLDRYLDTEDSEVLNKRQEVFEWKTEISKLSEEKQAIIKVDPNTKLSVIDSLKSTSKYLSSKVMEHKDLQIKQETIDAIQHQIELLGIRLQSINTRIENLQKRISDQFNSYKKFGYTLFAVFIHRGEASYGHYWVYIKDPKRNIYRKYNDDSVTEVPASEVFNFTKTNTATPYYMVFVKAELTDEYIEPLKRLIKC